MNAFNQLQNEISGFGHAQYPFLDAKYSPGSCAPVIDFTLWLRDRIGAGDAQSTFSLLQQITDRSEVTNTLVKMMGLFDLSSYVSADDTLINELMAIYVLAYRTRSYVSGHGHISLLAMLVEMAISLYPFRLRPEKLPELMRKLRNAKRNGEILELPPEGTTEHTPPVADKIIQKLRQLPPTCRFVLRDAIRQVESPTEPIRLRLSAYYDLRMYGCNEHWNAHYIGWLDWGSPITTDTDIARYVDKPALQIALDANGMVYKKSAKKSDLLDTARTNDSCWRMLCDTFSHEVVVFQPHILDQLQLWSHSISALRWTSYAIAAI
jgi:hypothetical protein